MHFTINKEIFSLKKNSSPEKIEVGYDLKFRPLS